MNSEPIQQLVFESGMQLSAVIVPAIALLLLCGWMLFRERRTTGLPCAFGFWCLRAAALSVFVWMFLQPARVTETKSALPTSIAIIVDNSDSMRVVDPAGEGQEVSWRLANLKADDSAPRNVQVSLDSAIMALDVAQSRWTQAQAQLQAGFDSALLKERFAEVAFALNRVSDRLDTPFPNQSEYSHEQQRARDFATQSAELADFVDALDWSKSSVDRAKRTQRSQEYLQALVDLNRLVKTWARTVSATFSQSLPPTESADRHAQVMQLVHETELQVIGDTDTDLNIKRFTFDEQLTPVLATDGWAATTPIRSEEAALGVDPPNKTNQTDEEHAPSATNLTAAIEQVTQLSHTQSIRSVVFLTDGAHNVIENKGPAEVVAAQNDLSISFVPIGSLKHSRDLQLMHVGHPRSVIRGDKIMIDAFVSATGFNGQTVSLELRADDELIDKKELSIDADLLDLKHSFSVPTDERESIEFELSIEPLNGETSTTNNQAIFRVGVVRDKIRVMLADRTSRWEYRYLDQLLFRDEHLEHEMILFRPRLRATGALKDDSSLPLTLEAWSKYDVAVVGDLTPKQFPVRSQEALVEFVKEKGGVAILIAGRSGMPHLFENQPLASLLPVEKSDTDIKPDKYHVSVNRLASNLESIRLDDVRATSEGLWTKVFEEQPITWLSEFSTPRPSARRLLDAVEAEDGTSNSDPKSQPAWVCWQQMGSGRVVYLSAPDTYRLRYRRGDRLHHRFWAQLLRWITSNDPGSDSGRVKLATDKVSYFPGEPIEVSVNLTDALGEAVEDADVQAIFESGNEEARSFPLAADETNPGRYVAKVADLEAGGYRVSLQGDVDSSTDNDQDVETFVNVTSALNAELVNTTCNRPLMKQIAQTSGGYVIPPTALAEWLTLQTRTPETISQNERMPLWNRWACLWTAFGCLTIEWCVRRMKGLT